MLSGWMKTSPYNHHYIALLYFLLFSISSNFEKNVNYKAQEKTIFKFLELPINHHGLCPKVILMFSYTYVNQFFCSSLGRHWCALLRSTVASNSGHWVLILGLFLTTRVVLGMECSIPGLVIFMY